MEEYKKALEFWDATFAQQSDADRKTDETGCEMLEKHLTGLAACGKVLDFGCGSGWASLYMAGTTKSACIDALDQSENAIKLAKQVQLAHGLEGRINFIAGDDETLQDTADGSYDAFFSSNVLDVVPGDVCERILALTARICRSGAPILIMLNPFADEAMRERLNMTEIARGCYAKNGIMRLLNRTTEEWNEVFSRFFVLDGYEEFRFPSEPDWYNRRLFIMKNK